MNRLVILSRSSMAFSLVVSMQLAAEADAEAPTGSARG